MNWNTCVPISVTSLSCCGNSRVILPMGFLQEILSFFKTQGKWTFFISWKVYFYHFQLPVQLSPLFLYGIETRAEHLGPGDVILGTERQEGQHGLHSLEANAGSGGCKLPWGMSPFSLAAMNENVTMLSYPPCSVLEVAAPAAESAEGEQTCTLAAPSCRQFEFNMKKSLHKDAKVETRLSTVWAW